MAEELRWETLFSTSITDIDAFGEFRNDTSADVFIRSIDIATVVTHTTTTTADQQGMVQLSKSNTMDQVNNSSIYQLNAPVAHQNNAITAGAMGSTITVNKLYAKGQLTLEPGESVFGHIDYTNAPTAARVAITIGYHF